MFSTLIPLFNPMKKLQLYVAAIKFANDNLTQTNPLLFAQASLAAFTAAGYDPLDLAFWQQSVAQAQQILTRMQNQKLPSEMAAKPVVTPPKT